MKDQIEQLRPVAIFVKVDNVQFNEWTFTGTLDEIVNKAIALRSQYGADAEIEADKIDYDYVEYSLFIKRLENGEELEARKQKCRKIAKRIDKQRQKDAAKLRARLLDQIDNAKSLIENTTAEIEAAQKELDSL